MKKSLFVLATTLLLSTASFAASRQEIINNPLFDTSDSRWKVMDDNYAAIQATKGNAILELIRNKQGCHIDFLSGVKYEKPLDKHYDYIFTTKKNGYAVTLKHDFHHVGDPTSEEYRHSLNTDEISAQGKKSLVGLLKRAARDDISSAVRISYGLTKPSAVKDGSYSLDNPLYSFGEFSLYYFVEVSDKLGCD
ncbi:MAG: hypothetical protein R3208_01915 [Ketobacteraceae bacterium]|nr:hypothetical protein [Ketobacteraceae bacterium]